MILPDAIDRIRPSIVQLRLMASDLSENYRRQINAPFFSLPIGTGFIVSEECHVITAHHVLRSPEIQTMLNSIPAGKKGIYLGFPEKNTESSRGNFQLVDFEIIREDSIHDLILLKSRRNPFKGEIHSMIQGPGGEEPLLFKRASLNPKRPRDGEAVAICGYPLSENILVTTAGSMATSWELKMSQVRVPGAPDWYIRPEISDTYLADIEVNPGNSGGPAFLIEDGTVIGVCVKIKLAPVYDNGIPNEELKYGTGLAQIVPIKYANELLKLANITI